MPSDTVKQRAIEALRTLPDDATLEDAIERLCLIAKIDEGLRQADVGQLPSGSGMLSTMTTLLCSILLLVGAWSGSEAHGITMARSTVPLSEGNVLGAAFYEEKGLFVVQQSVLSTEDNGLVIRFHRQLSSWSLANRAEIRKRAFDKAPKGKSPYPCGRVATSTTLHRVLICSAESRLEVIDPDSLNTVGAIALADDDIIRDFTIDDEHARVFVLSSPGDLRAIRLASYSLLNGGKQDEAIVPTITSMPMTMSVERGPRPGQLAVAVNVINHSRHAGIVFACAAESRLACAEVARVDEISQMSVWRRQLLIASGTFADDKRDCLSVVDLDNGSVARGYCSPSTGVHYAVATVQDKYVVGFTGVSKHHWFSEENTSVASTFSVWHGGIQQVAAVAKDPRDYGAFQRDMRAVGSSSEPVFMAYQRVSNTLFVYSITD